jgi:endonuclease/exonuclease/phosphatase family metal-dependent hydrolase
MKKIVFRRLAAVIPLTGIVMLLLSCEPLATGFSDTEAAQYYEASDITAVPDTFKTVHVMTWNIRFGAGRLPWFGDACGERVIFTEEEILTVLQAIADRINSEKPDILLLQEVDVNAKRSAYIDQVQWILDHTYFNYAAAGFQWKAQFIPSDGLGRLEEANATFSRWKISDAQRIELGLRNDQDELTRYFYERCCMLSCRIDIPGHDNIWTVNLHASAFAGDDTRQRQMIRIHSELKRIDEAGGWFMAGGDFNNLPPGSDTTDYCLEDMCPGESFHQPGDIPLHKEGSYYSAEQHLLDTLYLRYESAVPLAEYQADPYHHYTHTTRGTHFWDRTLDYLFTNYQWVEHSDVTWQQATFESDHVAVSVRFILPQ